LGDSLIFLRIPPYFSKAGGKSYIQKEGKRSTNAINSYFSMKIAPGFSNPRIDTIIILCGGANSFQAVTFSCLKNIKIMKCELKSSVNI
jgi:hypothetical protein